jgi:hypothetical protein
MDISNSSPRKELKSASEKLPSGSLSKIKKSPLKHSKEELIELKSEKIFILETYLLIPKKNLHPNSRNSVENMEKSSV